MRDPAGGTPFDADYVHDPDDNIRSITETQPTALTQTFTYDDLGRLTEVNASDPSRDRTYRYDAIGRMTSTSETGAYTYGDPAHLHAPTGTDAGHTRTYDANGNVTALQDPGGRDLTIDWTVGGFPERIVSHPSGAETPDRLRRRRPARRQARRSRHHLLLRALPREGSRRTVRQALLGRRPPRRPPRRQGRPHRHPPGPPRLHPADSPTAAASVREQYEYDPYGKLLGTSAPKQDERLWQGKRLDHDSGLTYMNARYYDAELATFISPDSIIPDPYRPQSLDRYGYVERNPISFVDPKGHMKMQVEMRKAQAAERSSFGYMYARALNSGCGPFQEQCLRYAPGTLIKEEYGWEKKSYKGGHVTRERQKIQTLSGGLDSEGNWNFNESSYITSYGLTARPVQVTVSQTRVAGDRVAAQPAAAIDSSSSSRGDSADPASGCLSCAPSNANEQPGVIGIGVGAAAQMFLGVELGLSLLIDRQGDVGVMLSPGYRFGPDIGLGSVSVNGFANFEATSINALSGEGVAFGFDLPAFSGSLQGSKTSDPARGFLWGAGGGVGIGVQLGAYVAATYSWVWNLGKPFRHTGSPVPEERRHWDRHH